MHRFDVIVVGGGIAGLSAAYELSRAGASFVLLEAAARPGGVILSEEIDGYTIDGGPDALLVQKPDGIRLCEELGLASRLVSPKPRSTSPSRSSPVSMPATSIVCRCARCSPGLPRPRANTAACFARSVPAIRGGQRCHHRVATAPFALCPAD